MVDLENVSNQDYLLFKIELLGWLELLGFDLGQTQTGQLARLLQLAWLLL